jgi:Tfp pilus assembly protein PilV
MAEMVVSVWLLMVISALAVNAIIGYYQTRNNHYWRQAAIWSADAQLQRFQAGADLQSEPPEDVIADQIKLTTEVEPGQGQWEGFNRITVTAAVSLMGNREIREQISGYVRAEVTP